MGNTMVAMIINGLGFTGTPLYMTPQYFEDKPIAQLLGKDIEAKSINDIALGRTLDKIYEYGVSDLFSKIASNAVKTLGISSKNRTFGLNCLCNQYRKRERNR